MSQSTVQILLVEDSPGDARLLQETLHASAASFSLACAQTLARALDMLRESRFDLILLDLMLPDASSLLGLKSVQAAATDVPIIVLTGMADEALGISAMREGAQDYLIKGQFDLRLLERSIRYAIERQRVQADLRRTATELRQSHEQLELRVEQRTADLAQAVDVLQAEIQARRQAQDELRDSEGRLRAVVRGVPLILWALDAKGTVTFAEGKGLGLLGLTSSQVIGKSMNDMGAAATQALQQALAGEEGSGVFSAGGMKFDTHYTPVLGPGGAVTGIIGVSMDVTERMHTQAQLHRANRALRVLSESSQAMMRASSQRDLLRQTCRTLVKIGGYQLAWVVLPCAKSGKIKLLAQAGLGPQFAQDPDWLQKHIGLTDKTILGGKPIVLRDMPGFSQHVEGQHAPAAAECRSIIALPLEVEPQAVGAMVICASDPDAFDSEEVQLLTELSREVSFGLAAQHARRERQQAQNALLEQAQIVDAFFEHTATPLAVLDGQMRFLRVNQAYTRAFSSEIDSLKGHRLKEFFPATVEKMFRKVLRSRKPVLEPAHPTTFDDRPELGMTYWDIAVVPVLDPDGKVDSLVLSLHDVTQRKRHEDRVLATNMLLEMFARKGSLKDYLHGVVELIQTWSSCANVGVRLSDIEHFVPYASAAGFSKTFCKRESPLSLQTDNCLCLRVIAGRPLEHDRPLMTARGSFVCRDIGAFVKTLDVQQCATLRGACVEFGFKTLALIPIRYRNQILGAIHITDPRENMLAAEVLESLELMAPLIGEAMQRFSIEEALRVSEEHFRSMIESSSDCIAHVSLDGRYISMNQVGCELHGFMNVKDLLGTKVIAGALENAEGFGLAMQLARQGETASVQYKSLDGHRNEIWWDCKLTPVRDASDQISSILMVARDATERRRLEREIVEISSAERRRIGQDLHDSLGQHLTGITFLCKSLQQRLANKSLAEAQNAGELSDLVNKAINQTRMLARGLCPVEPKAEGLISALRELTENIDATYKIPCLFTYDRTFALNDDYKANQLYHIVQECLTNAAKHSRATRIVVTLERTEGLIQLTVSDDGVGIQRAGGSGMGLRTMQYRAGMIGASLEIGRAGRHGTRIVCQVMDRAASIPPPKAN